MTGFGVCEKGNYRKENQDAILIRCKGRSGLFIVADGVGGSDNGAAASQYITERYDQWWKEEFLKARIRSFFDCFNSIKNLAEQINDSICMCYSAGKSCSTIVLLFIHKGIYGYLSVGDSRIYHYGKRGFRRITRDDVWENRPGADISSIHAGKIISAVGGFEKLEYSCATDKIHLGEIFILCSDGIYKFVTEISLKISMKTMYRSFFLQESMVKELAKKASDNDTKDNYSLVVVKV